MKDPISKFDEYVDKLKTKFIEEEIHGMVFENYKERIKENL